MVLAIHQMARVCPVSKHKMGRDRIKSQDDIGYVR